MHSALVVGSGAKFFSGNRDILLLHHYLCTLMSHTRLIAFVRRVVWNPIFLAKKQGINCSMLSILKVGPCINMSMKMLFNNIPVITMKKNNRTWISLMTYSALLASSFQNISIKNFPIIVIAREHDVDQTYCQANVDVSRVVQNADDIRNACENFIWLVGLGRYRHVSSKYDWTNACWLVR